jgi:hypothetical protein
MTKKDMMSIANVAFHTTIHGSPAADVRLLHLALIKNLHTQSQNTSLNTLLMQLVSNVLLWPSCSEEWILTGPFQGSTSRYILNACDLKLTRNPSNLGSLHLVHTEKYCWLEGTFIYTSKTGILSMMMFRQTGQCLHLSEQTLQTQFHRTSKNQQLCSLKAELSGTWGNLTAPWRMQDKLT